MKKNQIHLRENGDIVFILPPEFKPTSISNTALALRAQGRKGIPLHPNRKLLKEREASTVEAVLADHALLALSLLEAIHSDKPAVLRKIVDAFKKTDREADEAIKRDPINKAVARAARKAKGEPTEEQVQVALVEIGREGQGGTTPTGGAFDRSDKLHEKLVKRGFHLKKELKRGDNLRSPK